MAEAQTPPTPEELVALWQAAYQQLHAFNMQLVAEKTTLEAQLAAVTQERDKLSDVAWGKLKGGVPNQMGGQTATRTDCAMCGGDCTGSQNYAYGIRYCNTCVVSLGQEHLLEHARALMKMGGPAPVSAPSPSPSPQPALAPVRVSVSQNGDAKVSFKVSAVHDAPQSEWDAWIDSLQMKGQNP